MINHKSMLFIQKIKSYLKIYDKKLLRNYHKVSRKYQEKIFKLNY
jgi:hypothetical protein